MCVDDLCVTAPRCEAYCKASAIRESSELCAPQDVSECAGEPTCVAALREVGRGLQQICRETRATLLQTCRSATCSSVRMLEATE
jgi:hypothetical protein